MCRSVVEHCRNLTDTGVTGDSPLTLSFLFSRFEEKRCTYLGTMSDVNDSSVTDEKDSQKASTSNQHKVLKRIAMTRDTKFMTNFDPERSNREARKLEKLPIEKEKPRVRDAKYDDKGKLIGTGEDLCDCLNDDCPGCHFPCPKCRSCKCGHVCRRNRKWCYDEIEIEGTGQVIRRKK